MLIRFLTVSLVGTLAVWVALFDTRMSTLAITSSLLFCLVTLLAPYWLYLKYKTGVYYGPAVTTLVLWMAVSSVAIFFWKSDPGDWDFATFVTTHALFSAPAMLISYAVWRLMRWLTVKLPYIANALKIVFFTSAVVVAVAITLEFIEQDDQPTSTRISVGNDAALRFGDTVLFGTSSGIWGWTVSESDSLDRLLDDIPDASMFAITGYGTSVSSLLIVNSSAGVFCTDIKFTDAYRLALLPQVRGLFRAGSFAWVISHDGGLFRLETNGGACRDLDIVKVNLSGRKLAAAELTAENLLLVSCTTENSGGSNEDCAIHRWKIVADPTPPEEMRRISDLVSMVSSGSQIWIAGTNDLFEFRDDHPIELVRIEDVDRPILRMLLLAGLPWVESDSGSWLWSSTTSSFRPVQPVVRPKSYADIAGFRWVSSNEGLFRWKETDSETPFLLAANIGHVRRYERWEGCVWIGAEKGLFRICDGHPNQIERIADQASSVEDLIVAGWEEGVSPDDHPKSEPNILWAATDIGILRFSAKEPTVPIISNTEIMKGRLVAAGDYLWMISPKRFARWKLDATEGIEPLDYMPGVTARVCTDMNAAWFIADREVIRIPKVQTPYFWLDFENIKKFQRKPKEGTSDLADARYWNCQNFERIIFTRSYISRVTAR